MFQFFFQSFLFHNKMTMKRSSSENANVKKKFPKLDTEDDTVDYTKSLTAEDVEDIVSDNEEKLDDVNKPEKIKAAKKAQAIKKKTDKENKISKKTKGKLNNTNGMYILYEFNFICIFEVSLKLLLIY